MKRILIIIFVFIFIHPIKAEPEELKGTITVSGAWAMYPTVVAWADSFKKLNPKVKIDISAGGAGKGAADAITGMVDIGMVSREVDPAEISKGIKPVYILKDAVYPVVSEKNPILNELLKKGVKKQFFKEMYVAGTITSWNQVVQVQGHKPIHVYTRSDSSGAAASWAAYLGKKQEDLKGVGIYGDPGLLEAVRRDPMGIGYNNFSFVFTKEGGLFPGIKLVPIDANDNGVADPDEIYYHKKEAVVAIEKGLYPATRKNYFYIRSNASPLVLEFIKFALSEEGALIVDKAATSLPLNPGERKRSLKELGAN